MRTVFVTGGIGSGKSALCRILSEHGIPVYDSDSRTKELYDSDPELVPSLEKALGCRLTDDTGRLDRKVLASVIFSSKENLEILESIVHPAVLEDFLRWRDSFENADPKPPFVVMESAIVLQKPLFRGVADQIVLVDAPVETRLERACRRDRRSREEILERIANQSPDISRADIVIENDSTLEALAEKVRDILIGPQAD